jgi:hypothetical protein
MYKTSFSEALLNELRMAGADDNVLYSLSQAIDAIPQVGFDTDSSDDMIKCLGTSVSFIRNHIKHETMVMTNQEAWELDNYSRLSGMKKNKRLSTNVN